MKNKKLISDFILWFLLGFVCCAILLRVFVFKDPYLIKEKNINSQPICSFDVADIHLDNINIDTRPIVEVQELIPKDSTKEDITEELKFGDMELIAQLVQAEAGNQDLTGKRFVVDVVLNRVDSEIFPNTVESVIFDSGQFSVINNGMFDAAGWNISDECYEAVRIEYEQRLNYDILYFSVGRSQYMNQEAFKYGDHWFGY